MTLSQFAEESGYCHFVTMSKDVVRDDKGNAVTRWYDARKNLVQEEYPDGTKRLYEYEAPDANGTSYNRPTRSLLA